MFGVRLLLVSHPGDVTLILNWRLLYLCKYYDILLHVKYGGLVWVINAIFSHNTCNKTLEQDTIW